MQEFFESYDHNCRKKYWCILQAKGITIYQNEHHSVVKVFFILSCLPLQSLLGDTLEIHYINEYAYLPPTFLCAFSKTSFGKEVGNG